MNKELLVLLFTFAIGAILLLIVWIESLLSVPQVRWFGQDNFVIIAPLLLIIGIRLFLSARRKYVLPPHREIGRAAVGHRAWDLFHHPRVDYWCTVQRRVWKILCRRYRDLGIVHDLLLGTGRARENTRIMSLSERMHLSRAETFYAVVLPLLGLATVVSIIISIRTLPGFLTWSGSVIDFAMFVVIETVLIKVVRTRSDTRPKLAAGAVLNFVAGSAGVVMLGTILALVAISLFNGNARAINDVVTSMVGLPLLFILVGLNFTHRSRSSQHHEHANGAR